MRYDATEIILPEREIIVYHDMPTMGTAVPYKTLHESTIGGYPVWLAESANNFDNPLAQSSQKRYDEMGGWAEIFADNIPAQEGRLVGDRLELTAISDAGTEFQKEHTVRLPPNGFPVPTMDGIFHYDGESGILAPYETVEDIKEAVKRFEHAGLDPKYVSGFYRWDSYKDDERYFGRDFGPGWLGFVRFGVDARRRPLISGRGMVAARPRIITPNIVSEVDLRKKE